MAVPAGRQAPPSVAAIPGAAGPPAEAGPGSDRGDGIVGRGELDKLATAGKEVMPGVRARKAADAMRARRRRGIYRLVAATLIVAACVCSLVYCLQSLGGRLEVQSGSRVKQTWRLIRPDPSGRLGSPVGVPTTAPASQPTSGPDNVEFFGARPKADGK